jgi:diadenosine tetraphosphate (Ap4A) HIT family hydrolase
MFVTKDIDQFKNRFVTQLRDMLCDDELGAFILVLANSQQDKFLSDELSDDLENTFIALKNNFASISQNTAQDDVDVFKKLQSISLKNISVWQNKTIGHWQVSYNAMRQLRPARASSQSFSSIRQDFDENKFHFNKPFLRPEILWQGEYLNNKLRVLYNKFPFSDYHLLIAVSPEENSAQLLTRETHQLIYSLTQSSAKIPPGFSVGFNSLAAGASVNHLHFQGFVREQEFPIETDNWLHNGGEDEYPLNVKRFADAETSWNYINRLTEQDRAFNCLYRKNSCYVIPRQYQGSVELPDWLQGAGWLDVAGVMTVSDKKIFDAMDEPSVTSALGLLR